MSLFINTMQSGKIIDSGGRFDDSATLNLLII